MFCGKGNWRFTKRIQSEWGWSSWRRHGCEWLNTASVGDQLYTCISVIPLCDFLMLYLFISILDVYSSELSDHKAPDIIYIKKLLENDTWVTNSCHGEIWLSNQAVLLFWCCFITKVKSCMHLQQAWIVYVVRSPLLRKFTYSMSRIWFIAIIEPCRECIDCMLLWQEYPKYH